MSCLLAGFAWLPDALDRALPGRRDEGILLAKSGRAHRSFDALSCDGTIGRSVAEHAMGLSIIEDDTAPSDSNKCRSDRLMCLMSWQHWARIYHCRVRARALHCAMVRHNGIPLMRCRDQSWRGILVGRLLARSMARLSSSRWSVLMSAVSTRSSRLNHVGSAQFHCPLVEWPTVHL